MPADRAFIRRSALAAASSVVLAAGLLACDPDAGKSEDSAFTDTIPDDTAEDTKTDTADTADTDTGSCIGGEETGDTEPGDCIGIKDGEEWALCCEELRLWCEAAYPKDSQAALECLFGPDFSGEETGCIPWGPPVPPRATRLA